jgi:hypothetical protein
MEFDQSSECVQSLRRAWFASFGFRTTIVGIRRPSGGIPRASIHHIVLGGFILGVLLLEVLVVFTFGGI